MSKIIKVKAKPVKDAYVNNMEAYEWWNENCGGYGFWKGDLILETTDAKNAKETYNKMKKALPHVNMKLVRSFKDGYKIVFEDSTKDAIKDDTTGNQLYVCSIEPHSGHVEYITNKMGKEADNIIERAMSANDVKKKKSLFKDFYYGSKENIDKFYNECLNSLDDFYWIVDGPYELSNKMKEMLQITDSTNDGVTHLEIALKMEKDTINKYKEFARIAGDGDNPETQLWNHLIEDEEEHVREIEAAMKGDYTHVNDAENDFQQSVDGVAKLLRKAKLQENVSFAEGDQTYKTVLVETPEDKFDKVLEALKEEYKIDSHNGKNRIFVKIKDSINDDKLSVITKEIDKLADANYSSYDIYKTIHKNYPDLTANEMKEVLSRSKHASLRGAMLHWLRELGFKDAKENARNIEYIYEKPLEETTKKDEIVEEFVTQLFNTLADANIDANKYGIKEEDPYYYVEFLDEEEECKKAYEALCDSLFKCDLVIDKDDNYIKVLRR